MYYVLCLATRLMQRGSDRCRCPENSEILDEICLFEAVHIRSRNSWLQLWMRTHLHPEVPAIAITALTHTHTIKYLALSPHPCPHYHLLTNLLALIAQQHWTADFSPAGFTHSSTSSDWSIIRPYVKEGPRMKRPLLPGPNDDGTKMYIITS